MNRYELYPPQSAQSPQRCGCGLRSGVHGGERMRIGGSGSAGRRGGAVALGGVGLLRWRKGLGGRERRKTWIRMQKTMILLKYYRSLKSISLSGI
jgi:hypothetical protein